jgi:hypothetical protein
MKKRIAFIFTMVAISSAFAQTTRPTPPSSVVGPGVRAVNVFAYPVIPVPSTADIQAIATGVVNSACPSGYVLSGGACTAISGFGGVPTAAKLVETFAGRGVVVDWASLGAVQIVIDGANVCTASSAMGPPFCVGKYGPYAATNGYYSLSISPLGVTASSFSQVNQASSTTWTSDQLSAGQAPSTTNIPL